MAGAGGTRERMKVIGSDGGHVGTVDRIESGRIRLTRSDRGADGEHHPFPVSLVEEIDDDTVRLSFAAEAAPQFWET